MQAKRRKLSPKLYEIPDALVDHILTGEVMTDPVMAEDNLTYDRAAIQNWFDCCESNRLPITSPRTRQVIGTTLRENIDMRRVINEWKDLQEIPSPCQSISVSSSPVASYVPPVPELDSIMELNRYFEFLDPCRDTLRKALDGWSPPCVVLFGTESSGKSSIIERITAMSLFPQADKICTRVAVHVRLRRHHEAKLPELEVYCTETNQSLRRRVIPISTGHVDVKDEMQKIMRETSNGNTLAGINSKVILIIHIVSPRVPSLDLLDLPGIVAGTVPGEPSDLPQQTMELAKSYISTYCNCGIFLAVNCATQNSNSDLAYGLLQQMNIQAKTLGVITMCDKLYVSRKGIPYFDGRRLMERLGPNGLGAGSNMALEPYGYVCLINRDTTCEDDSEGMDEHSLLAEQVENERRIFSNKDIQCLADMNRLGIQALVARISTMYHDFLQSNWLPNTYMLLKDVIAANDLQNRQLGLPECDQSTEATRDAVVEAINNIKVPAFIKHMGQALQALVSEYLANADLRIVTIPVNYQDINIINQQEQTAILDKFLDLTRRVKALFVTEYANLFHQDTSDVKLGRFKTMMDQLCPNISATCFDPIFEPIPQLLSTMVTSHFTIPSPTVEVGFSRQGSAHIAISMHKIINDCICVTCIKPLADITTQLPAITASQLKLIWPHVNEVESCAAERAIIREEREKLLFAKAKVVELILSVENSPITEAEIQARWMGISSATLEIEGMLPVDIYPTIGKLFLEGHRYFPVNPRAYGLDDIDWTAQTVLKIRRTSDSTDIELRAPVIQAGVPPLPLTRGMQQDFFDDPDLHKHPILHLPDVTTTLISPSYVGSSLMPGEDMVNGKTYVIERAVIRGEQHAESERDVTKIVRKAFKNGQRWFSYKVDETADYMSHRRRPSLVMKLHGKDEVVAHSYKHISTLQYTGFGHEFIHVPSGVIQGRSVKL